MNSNNKHEETNGIDRRDFIAKTLVAGAGLAMLTAAPERVDAQKPRQQNKPVGDRKVGGKLSPCRRTLGTLEVSSVGLGVQNMSRKYETTVPYRPEMINIIRAAFDRGVTFFDAAEAYGPHEVERILGEGIAPFRDKVVDHVQVRLEHRPGDR